MRDELLRAALRLAQTSDWFDQASNNPNPCRAKPGAHVLIFGMPERIPALPRRTFSKTCATFLPPYSMSSVSRLKRHPPQTSQRTNAGGRKFISEFDLPRAFALRTTALRAVERKSARRITAQAALRELARTTGGSRQKPKRRWRESSVAWRPIGDCPLRERIGWIRGRIKF